MRTRCFLLGLFVVLIISSIFVAGCTSNSSLNQSNSTSTTIPNTTSLPPEGNPTIIKNNPESVVDANNQFAFDLYKNLRDDPNTGQNNIFFSPFSISSALAMTYEGARGKTADEILSVVHFPTDNEMRRQQFYDINTRITRNFPRYSLSTANAIWADKMYSFLPEYVQTIQHYYGADATNLDFRNSPEDSRAIINTWVANRTNGKIMDLVPPGSIVPSTRLVITNAVFFDGTWVYQFHPGDSSKFTISPGRTISANMMAAKDSSHTFDYTETDRFQSVELPYTHISGKELSMIVILPKGDNLTAVENSLDAENFSSVRKSLNPRLVFVFLPKFRIDTQYNMDPVLKNRGLSTAFTQNADFSGMDGSGNLFIDTIIHKAFVNVDEKGTQAAAASANSMGGEQSGAAPPVEPIIFNADHPFIFVIQDKENGNILFIGRVMNPNA